MAHPSPPTDDTSEPTETTLPPTDQFQFRYELRIPKDRIAVLIGKSGQTKEHIEAATQSNINVDSREGDVFVSGNDVLKLFQLREIVKAIGRGFNPEVSMLLLRQDYAFELINLTDYAKTKNHQQRVKGRVIGKDGKTREIIEQLTEVSISVYGKTIGVIGPLENANFASRAIDMLLQGSPHANVYKWLEQKRKLLKRRELLGDEQIEIKDEFKKYLE